MRAFSAVLSIVLVSAGALAFAWGGGEGAGGAGGVEPPPLPANTEFAGVLLRIDLGAEALSAAGVSGEQVSAAVSAVHGAYSPATLAGLDETFIGAKRTADRLLRLVQSGKGSQEDVAALRAAETALATATSARDSYLTGLRMAALATLSGNQATLLGRIHENRSWGLPTQYLVKDRTQAEWVALRAALATKRISERYEDEVCPQETHSYLAAIDGDGEIAAAKVNLDSHIASVQTSWNTAASD